MPDCVSIYIFSERIKLNKSIYFVLLIRKSVGDVMLLDTTIYIYIYIYTIDYLLFSCYLIK